MNAKAICEKALLRAAYYADKVHVKEDPPGNNRGKYVEIFQKFAGITPGTAWCAAFQQYTLHEGGWPESKMPPTKDWSRGTVCSVADYYLRLGVPITADLAKVVRGSAFYWCNRNTWHGHIGWVCEVDLENESFRTIEGNSRNRVDRRWRVLGDKAYKFILLPEAKL